MIAVGAAATHRGSYRRAGRARWSLDVPASLARIPQSQITELGRRYATTEDRPVENLVPTVRARGFVCKSELLVVADWKSPRRRNLIAEADEGLIVEASQLALTAASEELRIGILALLPGVGYPTASVILHFFHADPYPIIDFRALWSMGFPDPPSYTFSFWSEYVLACRKLASRAGVSMRDLDRALWQYSKQNQPVR